MSLQDAGLNFSPKTISALHAEIYGTYIEDSTSTANSDHDLWNLIMKTGNCPPEEAETIAGEYRYTSDRKPLIETLKSAPSRRMEKRRVELEV